MHRDSDSLWHAFAGLAFDKTAQWSTEDITIYICGGLKYIHKFFDTPVTEESNPIPTTWIKAGLSDS